MLSVSPLIEIFAFPIPLPTVCVVVVEGDERFEFVSYINHTFVLAPFPS